ncbi:hypothetical protein [Lyticum sinuosum]|uniref:Uncharacterized protein n=1 Tax=Lyticum sinuosum TaxID=1332059 RepID=A0AAE5AH43_9RICK|nr:hypothetical protein [Lyticum sinuosum]MDZ5761552.1 hypothetical protein [Lyticum sinuosum]
MNTIDKNSEDFGYTEYFRTHIFYDESKNKITSDNKLIIRDIEEELIKNNKLKIIKTYDKQDKKKKTENDEILEDNEKILKNAITKETGNGGIVVPNQKNKIINGEIGDTVINTLIGKNYSKNGTQFHYIKGDGNCGRRSMMWGILIRAAINIESQDLELNQKGKNILDIMEADAKYLLENGEDSFKNDNPDNGNLVELSNVSQRFSKEIVTVFKENNNANNIFNLIKCIRNKQIHSGDLLKLATVDSTIKGNVKNPLNISLGLSALSGYMAYKAVKSSLKNEDGNASFFDFTMSPPKEYLQMGESSSTESRKAIAHNFGNNIDFVDINIRNDYAYNAILLTGSNPDGSLKIKELTKILDINNPEHVKIVKKFVEEQFEEIGYQFNENEKNEITRKLIANKIVFTEEICKTYDNLKLKSPVYCITNNGHTVMMTDAKTRENLKYLKKDIFSIDPDLLNNQKSGLGQFLKEHANIKHQIQENKQSVGGNENRKNNSQTQEFQENIEQIQQSNTESDTIYDSFLRIINEKAQRSISEKLFIARYDLNKIYTSCDNLLKQSIRGSGLQKGSPEDKIYQEMQVKLTDIKSAINDIKLEIKDISIFKKIYECVLDFLVSIPAIFGIKLQRYENNQKIKKEMNNIINNTNNININRY